MKPKKYFMIRVIVVITIIAIFGLIFVMNFERSNQPGIGGEAQVKLTISNLTKQIEDIYLKEEGVKTEFKLHFPNDYKLCFFNSSNPSQTVTWNPNITTKYIINQSGYNAWYYKIREGDVAGHGYKFSYLKIPTEKNFCATGGSEIWIINKGFSIEISSEPV